MITSGLATQAITCCANPAPDIYCGEITTTGAPAPAYLYPYGSPVWILHCPDDDTWHAVYGVNGQLSATYELEVDQVATVDTGSRGYVVMDADDATKHRVGLALDGGVYRVNITQTSTSEAVDFSSLTMLVYGDPAGTPWPTQTWTLILDAGTYVLDT